MQQRQSHAPTHTDGRNKTVPGHPPNCAYNVESVGLILCLRADCVDTNCRAGRESVCLNKKKIYIIAALCDVPPVLHLV